MDQAPHKLDLQHLPASQAPWPHPGVLLATGSLPRIPQNSLGIISFSHTQFLLPKLQLSPAKVQSHQLIIPAQLSSNLTGTAKIQGFHCKLVFFLQVCIKFSDKSLLWAVAWHTDFQPGNNFYPLEIIIKQY